MSSVTVRLSVLISVMFVASGVLGVREALAQQRSSADVLETFVVEIREDADPALRAREKEIRELTYEALQAINKVRVISDGRIAFETGTRVIPETGSTAMSFGESSRIKVIVDVARPGWMDSLRVWLPTTLAHELCHIVRVRGFIGAVDPTVPPPPDHAAVAVADWMAWTKGRPPSLGDFVIHEGFADHFAQEIFGNGPYPWDRALQGEELEHWVSYVLEHWDDTEYNLPAWVGGSDEVPRQAAYAVGYRLVADYFAAHPGLRPSQVMLEPAGTFRPSK
jgi:hypothetical protein